MRNRILRIGLAASLAVAGLVGATLYAMRAGEPLRQVRLVARGMAFHLEGDPTPNPVIRVRPGERIEVQVQNETPGILHDFAVADLGVAIAPIAPDGVGNVAFRAPRSKGTHEYVCRPHAQMMRGVLAVTD